MIVCAGVDMTDVLARLGATRWTRRAHDPRMHGLSVACDRVLYR